MTQRPQRQRATAASRRRPDADLLRLQRLAGNGAVQRLVASSPTAASPAEIAARARDPRALRVSPVAKPPPDGAKEIKALDPRAGGVTQINATAPPSLDPDKPVQEDATTWSVRAKPTSAPQPTFDSFYPAAGLHDMGTKDALGCENFLHVTQPAADRIKAGEQEHIDDYLEAHRLSYAVEVNAVNTLGPAKGSSAAEARAALQQQLYDALPAKLRSPKPQSPDARWGPIFGELCKATSDRDDDHWHDIPRYYQHDKKELAKLPLPKDGCAEVSEYVETGGRIGVVGSSEQVKKRYDKLTDG